MKVHNFSPERNIQTVGIPRALLYHRYGTLWSVFFEQLGLTCVLSPETDREIVGRGSRYAIDESCLSSKIFFGHIDALLGKCDAVFVPRIANYGPYCDMCTKFHALPDLVRHTFRGKDLRVLDLEVDVTHDKPEKQAFLALAMQLGKSRREASRAWSAACKAQDNEERLRARQLNRAAKQKGGMKILLVGHPYVLRDEYLGAQPARILRELGAQVLLADEMNRSDARKACRSFSTMVPWMISRELIGAALSLRGSVDGIVLLTAFPCGPDSMMNEMLMRRIKDTPMVQLTLDVQDGTAGLETRLESFYDILHYKKEGGYGNSSS